MDPTPFVPRERHVAKVGQGRVALPERDVIAGVHQVIGRIECVDRLPRHLEARGKNEQFTRTDPCAEGPRCQRPVHIDFDAVEFHRDRLGEAPIEAGPKFGLQSRATDRSDTSHCIIDLGGRHQQVDVSELAVPWGESNGMCER